MDFVWLHLQMRQILPVASSTGTGNSSGRSNEDQGPGRVKETSLQEAMTRRTRQERGQNAAEYRHLLLVPHVCSERVSVVQRKSERERPGWTTSCSASLLTCSAPHTLLPEAELASVLRFHPVPMASSPTSAQKPHLCLYLSEAFHDLPRSPVLSYPCSPLSQPHTSRCCDNCTSVSLLRVNFLKAVS